MTEWMKAAAAYAVTAGLSAAASRYHLSPDQVTAIALDLGTVAAAVTGVLLHHNAGQNGDTK